MAKGFKSGGRKKGTVNKVTGEARETFRKIFEGLAPEAEDWIRETAEGKTETIVGEDGSEKTVQSVSPDPGKAADLLLKMAEYHIPKLGRIEHTGAGGEKLTVSVTITGLKKDGGE